MKLFNFILSPSPNWCCCGEKLRKALLWASRSWVLWRCRSPKTDGSTTRLETSGRRGRRRVNFQIKPIYYWNYAPKQENKLISPFRPENNYFHCKFSSKCQYFQTARSFVELQRWLPLYLKGVFSKIWHLYSFGTLVWCSYCHTQILSLEVSNPVQIFKIYPTYFKP